MPVPIWTFRKVEPATKRDPFEAEFFTEDKDDESIFSRTDALVRESVQNALDARIDPLKPVTVRFAVSKESELVSPEKVAPFLEVLDEHLDCVGNDVINKKVPREPMNFLVYEDFGTRGLCGDPKRTRDPEPNSTSEDYYWFWWNVGRSGKGGADRGRWGLGKTVFHSTSRIYSIFGLTVRSSDNRKLLMGQSVIKTHFIGNDEFPPEGFFHDPQLLKPIEQPSEDVDFIKQFELLFDLRRKDQTGLSLVVPYCFENLRATEILKTLIVQYFLPILRGHLIAIVSGPDLEEIQLNKNTIRNVAKGMKWNGKRTEKKHSPPPFDLAEWAIKKQVAGIDAELTPAGLSGAPAWSESLLDAPLLASMRKKFAAHERIAIRIPVTVEKKIGGATSSHFDVFIEHDESLEKGEDHFIREGMTISKVSTISAKRALRGLVLVEHKVLSGLLGDAEGPAHVDWGRTEDRPDKTYVKWPSRVSFVKNSLAKIIEYLTPPPQEVDFDLLSSIFSVADINKKGLKKKKKGKKTDSPQPPPPPPPPIPPVKPRWFKVSQTVGGFRIRRSGIIAPPIGSKLRVRAAYDMAGDNPFKGWSAFDFVFDGKSSNPIKMEVLGASLSFQNNNEFIMEVHEVGFLIDVQGFDKVRDLVIRYNELSDNEDVAEPALEPINAGEEGETA